MAKNRQYFMGFTIIEVVLVLAIAGLIFLAVFSALSAAQRAQRDQQRRNDAGALYNAIIQWKINNRIGKLDTDTALQSLKTKGYFDAKDPLTGQPYTLPFYSHSVIHGDVVAPPVGQIAYVAGHYCGSDAGGNTLISSAANTSDDLPQFAILVALENGGGAYCLDSRTQP